MAPTAYQPFFAASMGAAAALLGLLFVAVSVAPERTVGAGAPVERQVVAEGVFTALIDAFFISMGGAIPDINLGSVALVLSLFALFQTLHMGWRLWPRQPTLRSTIRRLTLVVVALVIYAAQLRDAFQLVSLPPSGASVGGEISILFALYAFALGRSWELLGARRGILTSRLSPTSESKNEPGTTPLPAAKPVAAEGPDLTGKGVTES